MKFELIVEGYTEADCVADFMKRWLDPRLSEPVGIKVTNEKGHAGFMQKIVKKANAKLAAPGNSEIIAVLGLLDLYGPDFYPASKSTIQERYNCGKQEIERRVDNDRFRMFFAVHESEAWLLSQPDIFPSRVRKILPEKIASPETVNFRQPPAKLLDQLYKQATRKGYKKITYDKQLFAKLDPQVAVSKCPYLQSMLDDMLSMAKKAGL